MKTELEIVCAASVFVCMCVLYCAESFVAITIEWILNGNGKKTTKINSLIILLH